MSALTLVKHKRWERPGSDSEPRSISTNTFFL